MKQLRPSDLHSVSTCSNLQREKYSKNILKKHDHIVNVCRTWFVDAGITGGGFCAGGQKKRLRWNDGNTTSDWNQSVRLLVVAWFWKQILLF